MPEDAYADAAIRALARTFAVFYKGLVEEGVPATDALEITKVYVKEISNGAREINEQRGASGQPPAGGS